MTNFRQSMKNKFVDVRPALIAVAGMSTLMSAVYFAGKSNGKKTFVLFLDDNSVINLNALEQ